MPAYLLKAYMEMLPRLNAEERLERITDIAVGTGALKKDMAERVIRDLERLGSADVHAPPVTEGQHKVVASSMRIQVGKRKKENATKSR